jgi:hypothetical protein
MFKFQLIIMALWLSGCATLAADGVPGAYSPENQASGKRSGVVAYNPEGITELVNIRKEDAYKQIVNFCGSRRYQIVGEKKVPVAKSKAASGVALFGAESVVEINFVCND